MDVACKLDLVAAFELKSSDGAARLYFREPRSEKLCLPKFDIETSWSREISGAQIMNVKSNGAGGVNLQAGINTESVSLCRTEYDLFADRNVLLGTSNGESAETWRDWLLWHRRYHGANAALIIDRSPPKAIDERSSKLSMLLQNDKEAARELSSMTIVVLGFDQPMGHPNLGHQAHPMNAPDAPGKDRMEMPIADPWHAPLSYRLLYDLAHWKFLKLSGAVVNLNVHELIRLGDDKLSVFAAVKQTRGGAILLRGQRVYPWSLRRAKEPSFGDHICKRFDVSSFETRWCVSPAKLPAEAIWMPTRILGTNAKPTDLGFWRFMGLQHCRPGGASIGKIVPKSSLSENAELLKIAKHFGADPKRQPSFSPIVTNDRKAGAKSQNRVAVVTTMKNEGPFILEWIAYHRAIGVNDFLVYTNDCTDGTDDLLRLLEKKGFCQWRENPYRNTKLKPQHAALQAAEGEELLKRADWLICMDVDEYIAVHTGDQTLSALFNAVPDANMISITWRLFGNDDIDAFGDFFVTQSFTSASREFANKPHVAWGFKTLFRNNGNFRKMGVHRPKGIQPKAVESINWVNGSGEPMPKDQWRNAWRSNKVTYGYDLVSMNHYAVRSAESFLVKRDRGRVNHVDRDQGLAYWFRMNHNVVKDARMHLMLPKLKTQYDAMLADPEIRAAHEACVTAHQKKIIRLKEQPKYKAFFEMLVSERMRKLSRLHGHFGTNVYLSGPSVIPDAIIERDPDEEFFFTIEHVGEAEH